MNNKKIKKIVFLVLWNIFIVSIGLELLLRFFLPTPMFYKIKIGDNKEYRLSPNANLVYEPNPDTKDKYWGKKYPLTKRDGKKRIVFMGDSAVYGLGAKLEDRFTELLIKKVDDEYEIINLGVSGYNLLQEFEYFKKEALRYRPDYVIFGITNNDLVVCSGQQQEIASYIKREKNKEKLYYYYYYSTKDKADDILLKSYLYKYLKYLLFYRDNYTFDKMYADARHISSPTDAVGRDISLEEARDIIEKLKNLSLHKNFKLSFMFLPVRKHPLAQHQVREIVRDEMIRYLDINEILNKKYTFLYKDSLFVKDSHCHLNEEGHRIVAELLYKNRDSLFLN